MGIQQQALGGPWLLVGFAALGFAETQPLPSPPSVRKDEALKAPSSVQCLCSAAALGSSAP